MVPAKSDQFKRPIPPLLLPPRAAKVALTYYIPPNLGDARERDSVYVAQQRAKAQHVLENSELSTAGTGRGKVLKSVEGTYTKTRPTFSYYSIRALQS